MPHHVTDYALLPVNQVQVCTDVADLRDVMMHGSSFSEVQASETQQTINKL